MNKCLACYKALNGILNGILNEGLSGGLYHAACAKKLFGTEDVSELNFDIDHLNVIAKEYTADRLGIPGVQKKLSVKLSKESQDNNGRLTIIGYLNGTHILKPASKDYSAMPEIEDLCMHLAGLLKIDVAEHSLVKLNNGELAYICKRFDRHADKKIAVEDFCQLSRKLTVNKYRSSSEQLAKVIQKYSSNPGDDKLKLFELLLFSFLIGNADMHLKNFTLMTGDSDFIRLSPAYDLLSTRLLISEHEDREELALPLNGKKHNLRRKDWFSFAETIGLDKRVVERTVDGFMSRREVLIEFIEKSFLLDEMKEAFVGLLDSRLKRI